MNLIQIKDVSYNYPTKKDTLKHVSFDVKACETIALVGPTGA